MRGCENVQMINQMYQLIIIIFGIDSQDILYDIKEINIDSSMKILILIFFKF